MDFLLEILCILIILKIVFDASASTNLQLLSSWDFSVNIFQLLIRIIYVVCGKLALKLLFVIGIVAGFGC